MSTSSEYLFEDDVFAAECFETGCFLQKKKKFREAIEQYDKVLKIDAFSKFTVDYSRYARWNKAMALLSLGDYDQGFIEHDVAWDLFDWGGFGPLSDGDYNRLMETLPRWYGQADVSNKSLLVYHEMGHGDAIMASRYLPQLRNRASKITLVTLYPLVKLLRRFGIEVTDRLPENLDGYDYRLPCLGVMRALKQSVDTVPRDPYIPKVQWRTRKGTIGIAWSGRTQRSLFLERFLSLLDYRDFDLYALQLGTVQDGITKLQSRLFDDTANLIEEMEHVVTVDTAAAHLAGAMGHPSVHLLLPYLKEWRWYHSEAWYPKMKIYQQENERGWQEETELDWSVPFARLNEALNGSFV